MIRYRDSKNLKRKLITMHNGETEYSLNCASIGGKYYLKDKECFFDPLYGNWCLIEKHYDHETKQQVNSKRHLIYGIVDVDENGNFVMGHFSQNVTKNVRCIYVSDEQEFRDSQRGIVDGRCIDSSLLDKNKFLEAIGDDIFVEKRLKKYVSEVSYDKHRVYKNLVNNYIYEESKQLDSVISTYHNNSFKIEMPIAKMADLLGDLSWGCEIETVSGKLPNRFLYKYGLVICKDGSIDYTPEYVTIPMKGAKGLQAIKNTFIELQKRTTTSSNCSLHYHFGNTSTKREYIVKIFKLFYMIQDDLYKMLPGYKVKWQGIKRNDYCRRLPDLVSNYNGGDYKEYIRTQYIKIEKFIYGDLNPSGEFFRHGNNNPWGENKWNIKTRLEKRPYRVIYIELK